MVRVVGRSKSCMQTSGKSAIQQGDCMSSSVVATWDPPHRTGRLTGRGALLRIEGDYSSLSILNSRYAMSGGLEGRMILQWASLEIWNSPRTHCLPIKPVEIV